MTERLPDLDFELPDEPPDFWDSAPPEGDWSPPEPPSDTDMTPDFAALIDALAKSESLPEPAETPEAQMALFDYAPEDDPFAPAALDIGAAPDDERVPVPGDSWERYLASFLPNSDPEALEQALRGRAEALDLVDARFLGLEQRDEGGQITGYEIGCLEVYADAVNGGYSGQYLGLAEFQDMAEAERLYHELQGHVHNDGLPVYAVHDFAEHLARERELPVQWRDATAEDMARYVEQLGLEGPGDDPPPDLQEELARQAAAPGSAEIATPEPPQAPLPAFNALGAIGIEAADFDPDHDPPPFYDPETGTAYWIGVFQPDLEDPAHCVASILSLGRNPETGTLEAQLAPCVPGDWDKAYASSQHLLDVMQRDGLETCFLAAESMAIATDQRDLWESGRGLPLEPDYAQQAAEYTRETWKLEL